jgi:hypothetical protein
METYVARKLAHDDRLRSRWDIIWSATDDDCYEGDREPPVALVESLVEAAELFLEEGDWESARVILPKLSLIEGTHGTGSVLPGSLAGRVDSVRFALKDRDDG